MKKCRKFLTTVGVALASINIAFAQPPTKYIQAEVVDVVPLKEEIIRYVPQQHCYTVQVPQQQTIYPRQSNTGSLIGGLVGAYAGNRAGKDSRNRDLATIAGGVVGAHIGSNYNPKPTHHVYYTSQQRCSQTQVRKTETRLTGYRVTYNYQGTLYQTVTQSHPGTTITLTITTSP